MDRSGSIVYLGTEGNLKSCLGLEEILADGWNVVLVIAYQGPPLDLQVRPSPAQVARRFARKLVGLCPPAKRLIRGLLGRHRVSIEFKHMDQLCSEHGVPYVSTSDRSLHTVAPEVEEAEPAVVLSNGWMFKIPEDIYSVARLIALNCHSSYLPEYRGGNVTYAPLINEEEESGVTVHQLVGKFDAGPILAQRRVRIEPRETPHSLNVKRAQITGELLIEALHAAGHEDIYKPNPPSPFYFRCNRATYMRYRLVNFVRKLLGLHIKPFEGRDRYDI